MWVQAALFAAQMWLGEVMRKRPHKVTFEEFLKSNQPSETRPIMYVAGTKEIIPSRKWYGDFTQRAVERDSHWSDYLWAGLFAGLLDTITVAYRYYCGEMFELCYGPNTHVEQVKIRDRLMFQAVVGTDNAGGGFLIDDPQAWGGDQPPGEGGEYCWIDITRGNYTDLPNAYLESLLTTPPNKTESLRGVSCLIKRGRLTEDSPAGFLESGYFAAGGVGYNPHFGEWKITVRRQPNNLGTLFSKIGRNANPMEVIWEWATSIEYGARLPIEKINLASLQSAAQTLHAEGNGWSGKIETPTSPLDVCKNVAAQVDAVLDASPSLGWTVRLIRRDYSFGTLPVLDKSVITRIDGYSPGSYEDTVNKIILPYKDINNNSADRPALYIDPANISIQGGRVLPQTQEYIGVGDSTQANLLVTRDGRALSLPRGPLECWVKPSWGRLRYRGEVVKWVWESPNFTKLLRITSVTPNNIDTSDYKIIGIEEQFSTGARASGEPAETEHIDPGAVLSVAPPSASWDTVANPPDGLIQVVLELNTTSLTNFIDGRIIFGNYPAGGQFARIYVTEPGGSQTLSPLYLSPDANNKTFFQWPVSITGPYEFCIQTFSIGQGSPTNGVKICAEINVTALMAADVRQLEDGTTRHLEDNTVRILE